MKIEPCATCRAKCPDCGLGLCSDAQIDEIVTKYVDVMRCRGFAIGPREVQAIRRAASIQDVWRVAFARVVGPDTTPALDNLTTTSGPL